MSPAGQWANEAYPIHTQYPIYTQYVLNFPHWDQKGEGSHWIFSAYVSDKVGKYSLTFFSRPCSHCFCICQYLFVWSCSVLQQGHGAEPSQFSWEYIALLMVDVWVPIRNELDHDYILRPCPFWHIPERYLPSLGDPLQWINIKDFALTILHKLGFEFDPLWWCSMISCFQDTLASGWIMPYIRNDNWFNEKGLTITYSSNNYVFCEDVSPEKREWTSGIFAAKDNRVKGVSPPESPTM